MVSIVVVGKSMSGKTHLCMMLSGLASAPPSIYADTRGTNFLKLDVNDRPWHVWDTPAYEESGWSAESIANEADIIVICHDGTRGDNPCYFLDVFGPSRCIIALVRTPFAGANLSWASDYFRRLTWNGSLVPVVHAFDTADDLIVAIHRHHCAVQADLGGDDVYV